MYDIHRVYKEFQNWSEVTIKGESHAINGRKVMLTISNQLMDQLVQFDIASYGQMYDCTKRKCFDQGNMGIVKAFAGWTVQILVPLLGLLVVGRAYRLLEHSWNCPAIVWQVVILVWLWDGLCTHIYFMKPFSPLTNIWRRGTGRL